MSPRVALAVAGLAALALPAPALDIAGIVLTAIGLLTLGGAVLHPGTTAPAMLIALAALSWLASDAGGVAVRLPALALALTVVHSAAALAAVVPARSRVPRALLLRWAGWSLLATVGGAAAVGVTGLLPAAAPVPLTVAALAVLGAAAGVGAVVLGRLRRAAVE
jgi:hypothetical protein